MTQTTTLAPASEAANHAGRLKSGSDPCQLRSRCQIRCKLPWRIGSSTNRRENAAMTKVAAISSNDRTAPGLLFVGVVSTITG
jgi:hypothetical protein